MPDSRPLTDRARLSAAALARVRADVVPHTTLERVLRWVHAPAPQGGGAPGVEEIVTQDEYTHDVVVRYRDGLYLVYDTT